MIIKAVEFASENHAGQFRKGAKIPYFSHCLEVGAIAYQLAVDNNVISDDVVAAAILHDVLEDTDVTAEDLKKSFNENIADLVESQSEDKSKSWMERKQATIEFLTENNSVEVEIIILADKLSNMRVIYKDYEVEQEHLWTRFNAGKELQSWYYKSIGESLSQVIDSYEYEEFKRLIKLTFGVD